MKVLVRMTGMAAAFIAAAAMAVGANTVEFTNVFCTSQASYLVTSIGEVYTMRQGSPLRKILVFHDAQGRPYRWAHAPMSFVHWNKHWFVADGSNHLLRFADSGTFEGLIEVPVRVPALATTDDAIWAANMVASNGAELWRSTDGRTFSPYTTGIRAARSDSLVSRLVVVRGSSAGDVYVASVVGAPVVHRVWPTERRAEYVIAYSRSKARDEMKEAVGPVADVTSYSLPVRDLLPLSDGGFALIRNREDVRGSGPGLALLKGRRADRYDRAGRQIATAVFARSVHWLTEVGDGSVTGVSNTGDVVVANWGKAVPGEIISP